ncbi:MAG: hypothetical protein GTO42_08540 [Candidatus Latescibacteria bacterium]|nr:hypothetical protein [Candidatus Latescibacterota bacterium]NIO29006.1 hypothetical protein [Candidatus Latescibacterota bacterium]NIO56631.1 hypothetical protein [Candidatus Latescibacterota bacterium]NIT02215.1 hypothetical protein [Candidatus Latescibacterota bacterium]NIT39100.1 hypothetical protein [Candidatus Latescibacterota bacterium]
MTRILCISIILALFLAQDVFAQDDIRTFSRFRLRLKSGERIEGRKGRLTATFLEGTSKTGRPIQIPVTDIRLLDVTAGSKAVKGMFIGAGIGLISAMSTIASVKAIREDADIEWGGAAGFAAGLTVVGGVIGAGIGWGFPKWERVHLGTDSSTNFDFRAEVCLIRIHF